MHFRQYSTHGEPHVSARFSSMQTCHIGELHMPELRAFTLYEGAHAVREDSFAHSVKHLFTSLGNKLGWK